MIEGHAAARWIVGLGAAYAVLGIAAIAPGQPQSRPEPLDATRDLDGMMPSLAGAFAKPKGRTGPTIPSDEPTMEAIRWMDQNFPAPPRYWTDDFDGDRVPRTDEDIDAFLECLAGDCCRTCASPDFDGDGRAGTDADIESFVRVLAGSAY